MNILNSTLDYLFSRPSYLPLRTRLAAHLVSRIARAQSEACYEEIDSVPASWLGLKSEFRAGHVYVVHPVTYWDVCGGGMLGY
jgi:hypothetical protein